MLKHPISELSIIGFKSIRDLRKFPLTNLNVMIGPNGAGKSNFVSYFRMLGELIEGRLQNWTTKQGSADRIVSFGVKETKELKSRVYFGKNAYKFILEPTVEGGFVFTDESVHFDGKFGPKTFSIGAGIKESSLKKWSDDEHPPGIASYCFGSISNWKVFHFHDTSDTAGVKRLGAVHDNQNLRSDASNLAAFLYRLSRTARQDYEQILSIVRQAVPFFDAFVFDPIQLPSGEEQIRLLWRQKGSDYPLWPNQLSDGSIRFICLVTVLMQPDPPSTIIIDEPELGLHPAAIGLLGDMLHAASTRMQVIVSTQSVELVNEFKVEELVIVEREEGASVFKRFNEGEFKEWLTEYTVGELWLKNLLGGRP